MLGIRVSWNSVITTGDSLGEFITSHEASGSAGNESAGSDSIQDGHQKSEGRRPPEESQAQKEKVSTRLNKQLIKLI